jgi:hypothetical protein
MPSDVLKELLGADNEVEKAHGTKNAIISRLPSCQEGRSQAHLQHAEDQRCGAMHLLDEWDRRKHSLQRGTLPR